MPTSPLATILFTVNSVSAAWLFRAKVIVFHHGDVVIAMLTWVLYVLRPWVRAEYVPLIAGLNGNRQSIVLFEVTRPRHGPCWSYEFSQVGNGFDAETKKCRHMTARVPNMF